MSETLGRAVLELTTDDRALDKGLASAKGKTEALADSFDRQGQRMQQVGGRLSLAVTAPITAMAVTSISKSREQAKAIAGVEAALASMGDGAGYTSQQLQDMASQLQAESLYGDEAILQKVTGNLLTFGNISGEAFGRAQRAALDLSARLGTDLQSSTIMLGKALNDPVVGLTAMQRVGISFTEQQKEQIKAMAEAGDVAGAQALILAELERQYGGQAAAAAAADGGITQLSNSFGDFQEQIGAVIMQFLPGLVSGLSGVVTWLQSLDPQTKQWVVGIGLAAAAIGPLALVLGTMARGIGMLIGPIGTIIRLFTLLGPAIGVVGKAMMLLAANPVFLAIAAAVGAIYLAYQNWDKIKPIIDAVGQAISAWWTGTVQPVLTAVGNFVKEIVERFQQYFGQQLGNVVAGVKALINGDFKGAWEAAKRFAMAPLEAIMGLVNKFAPNVTGKMRELYHGVKEWLQDKLGAVMDWVRAKIEMVEAAFAWLWDRVVGNSWIPDLVRDVGTSMKGLDDAMVKPALEAVRLVDEAFAGMKPPRFPPAGPLDGYVLPRQVPGISPFAAPLPGAGASDNFGFGAAMEEDEGRMAESFAKTFSKGIRAAIDGDLGGFLTNWLSQLGDRLLTNALDGIGQLLGNALGGLGGGGAGIFGFIGSLFAGGFHTGGSIPLGQFGIVGERGPEPVFSTARGALVRPSRALNDNALRPAGAHVNMPIHIDATGADPAALERVRGEVERLREELPGQIVQTVQNAGDRRILSTGDWR